LVTLFNGNVHFRYTHKQYLSPITADNTESTSKYSEKIRLGEGHLTVES